MAFLLGVILFAIGIAVTIALHEWGHLTAARLCNMRVRRYFIGFGPTIWSFRRRHAGAGGHFTEYGLKAIPFGGFCDIAGMTAQDPIQPEEEPYAMYAKPWWQRIIVLLGGVAMNLVVGLVLIYFIALAWGLPNLNVDLTPRVATVQCVSTTVGADGKAEPCTGVGPAERAGLRPGDVITAVNATPVKGYPEAVSLIGADTDGQIDITVDRAGESRTFTIEPERINYTDGNGRPASRPAIGIGFERPTGGIDTFNAVTAVPGALVFTGQLFGAVWDGLLSIPEKLPGVVASIFGAQRDPASPMSVVGAPRGRRAGRVQPVAQLLPAAREPQLLPRRVQPGPASASRRRAHRGCYLRAHPRSGAQAAGKARPGACRLHQADAGDDGVYRRAVGVWCRRYCGGRGQPDSAVLIGCSRAAGWGGGEPTRPVRAWC